MTKANEFKVSRKSQEVSFAGSEVFKLFSLPKVELQTFSGDALSYHSFIKSFKVNVEKLCSDPDARLARLLQYTDGQAKEAIKSSVYVGGEKGYKQALSTLEDLFGSKHKVTQDVIKSLRVNKPVKSANDMCALSHELRYAFQVLEDIGAVHELDSQILIFDLIARLPNYIQNRWCKEELKHKHTSGSYLKFQRSCRFRSSDQ